MTDKIALITVAFISSVIGFFLTIRNLKLEKSKKIAENKLNALRVHVLEEKKKQLNENEGEINGLKNEIDNAYTDYMDDYDKYIASKDADK